MESIGAELHAPVTEAGDRWHIVAAGLPLEFAPPSATDRTTVSRSVTMPIGLPFSTTGTAPVSSSRMMRAAF